MIETSTSVQYTDGLGDKWLERELKHINLGDIRLNKGKNKRKPVGLFSSRYKLFGF